MHNLYLSLGSNLGDRRQYIQQAIDMIDDLVGAVYRVSNMLETEPWGFETEHRFLNCCLLVHTMLSPRRCLEATKEIERQLGRTQKSEGGVYHDRTIDIDMLMYDDLTLDEPDLVLPHPHMQERDFVMIPLSEIMS